MSFAGVSSIGGGRLSTRSTPATAAAATAVTDSGYYLLVVDGYSRTKETTPNGDWIESRPFRVGGHVWRIKYYPNGTKPEVADYISLALVLVDDGNAADTVKVQLKFSFFDKAEKQVPLNIHGNPVSNFCISTGLTRASINNFIKREDLEKSAHLKDDRLTIKCDIVVTKDVDVDSIEANTTPFVVVPASDLHQHLSSLLKSGEGSDVSFEIGGEIFAAHRCVLACRSTVFKGLLSGSMKEGTNTTAGTVVRIDDMEARVFKLLLGFIYSDSEPEMEEEDEDGVMWQNLFVAADRYGLPRLRLICEQKLCTNISATTAVTILALAERHHGQGLKDACLDFLVRDQAHLQEVMVLGGLDHLASSCPLVLKELIAKLVSVSPKIDVDNKGDKSAAAPAPAFVVVPASDMHRHFTQLLRFGEGTDVVFEVSGEKIHAHRCVLAARSTVFRAELFGPMKEGTIDGVMLIDDIEAIVFKWLLLFIYSDLMPDEIYSILMPDDINQEDEEYDNEKDEKDMEHDDDYIFDDDVMWQLLLVAADRYDLQRLRLRCEQELCGYINVTTVASILELAEQHHCRGLKEACLDFLNFPPNLQQVTAAGGLNHMKSSCPSVLIDLIAKLANLKAEA